MTSKWKISPQTLSLSARLELDSNLFELDSRFHLNIEVYITADREFVLWNTYFSI